MTGSEGSQARSKAPDLGSIPAGVRRFESGSSHFVFDFVSYNFTICSAKLSGGDIFLPDVE